jgi:hypothetical protein
VTANEDEIPKAGKDKYEKRREKLIGKTLGV